MTAALIVALVIAVLFAALFGGAYRTADREVIARDEQIRSLRAEMTLTQEACDRQSVKVRHYSDQAKKYHAEASQMAARNQELRDQVDALGGSQPQPTLTEEWLAFMAELDVTFPEDNR
ncbi:hypothetical protein ABZ749_01185 [Micromonospora sp. NPDC047753]|uniref:hypothetical protein n=1 Tax=Micromonospora sp. NPDC047753 TaxID=3154817 RepID=UPI0033D43AD9